MKPKKAANKQLSPNFSELELACKCCNMLYYRQDLIDKLEALRKAAGNRPVTINSGYRCAKHNAAVGGVSTSQHLLGKAADIEVAGLAPAKVAELAEKVGFGGIGLYDSFCHVDVGPKRKWKG